MKLQDSRPFHNHRSAQTNEMRELSSNVEKFMESPWVSGQN